MQILQGTILASAPFKSIPLSDVNPFSWSQVVQAIGASETNLLDTSGPKRVDGEAAVNLVKAADKLGVLQYVMVTSLGTGKFGWPASELGSFARGWQSEQQQIGWPELQQVMPSCQGVAKHVHGSKVRRAASAGLVWVLANGQRHSACQAVP